MLLNLENILSRTNRGLLLYKYILQEHFPRKDIATLLKKGKPLPNPFIAGSQLLVRMKDGTYCHRDRIFPDFQGSAIDFAGQHFRAATNHELYYMINQCLRLGLRIPAEELLQQLQKKEEEGLPRFSYFRPPITNTRPSEALSLPQLFQRIISTEYQAVTDSFRQLEDPKEARQFKARHFSYVTFAGRFEKRDDQHLVSPSGLMVIDLDHLQDVAAIREALIAERTYDTELLFVSPSGNGIKWVTSYPHQEISHQEHFRQLCTYLEAFDLQADVSGRDTSRACFICRDENAFLNGKYLFPP